MNVHKSVSEVVRFCVVIPVFRHAEPLRKILVSLDLFELPVLLVDDGNDPPLLDTLSNDISNRPWVRIERISTNSGKGAASMVGLRWAFRQGFSNAIFLDADGQHDVGEIPRLMEIALSHPNALILGVPVFGTDAPRSRRWGRLLTTSWTWIETLSFDIGDALFGFRCYPVPPAHQLIESVNLNFRMGFDPEIVVRLHWAGVRVVNFKTKVQYPEKGISNFRLVRDNMALCKLHTKLFFGMIIRWVTGKIR
ncbi:MAG: glycosyltransferase family 2 protein [Elusimicrobia bacterium]|jgi:glycosyltransferase involved in cell wall biosynthesis|nr:glycosyltransferase family 2 protein [Elusimicrobiota bacterium]